MDLFGEIVNGEMHVNEGGGIAEIRLWAIPDHFPNAELDEFIVMPNHLHGIITIMDNVHGYIPNATPDINTAGFVGARQCRAPTVIEQFGRPVPGSIPTIVRAYKSIVTKRINEIRSNPGAPVWQRNYYEHIIRDEKELSRFRKYIRNNPLQWENDLENR